MKKQVHISFSRVVGEELVHCTVYTDGTVAMKWKGEEFTGKAGAMGSKLLNKIGRKKNPWPKEALAVMNHVLGGRLRVGSVSSGGYDGPCPLRDGGVNIMHTHAHDGTILIPIIVRDDNPTLH